MPNTPVRAAAEGLPKINRRQILGSLAVSSAAAALVTTTIPAAAADLPDAALFRLDQEMADAYATMEQASEVCSRIAVECDELYPPRPAKWEEPPMPGDIHELWVSMPISAFRYPEKEPEPVSAWRRARDEEKAAHKALQDAYGAKCGEIDRKYGIKAAEDAFDARVSELWNIGQRIFATPANTLEGMAIKLRAAERLGSRSYADDNQAFESIAEDIGRLAGSGVR